MIFLEEYVIGSTGIYATMSGGECWPNTSPILLYGAFCGHFIPEEFPVQVMSRNVFFLSEMCL